MLAGRGSLTLNAISITRTGENQKIPLSDRIWLAPAAEGPARRIGLMHLMDVYVIWKFADNIEGAKQFLVDYVGISTKPFKPVNFTISRAFPAPRPLCPRSSKMILRLHLATSTMYLRASRIG